MIVYSLDLGLKARIGMLAYWWEGAREVFRYNFQHFRIRIGDQKLDASLAIVGRTKNYGGPSRSPRRLISSKTSSKSWPSPRKAASAI